MRIVPWFLPLLAACIAPARLAPDADLVPCPLTARANALLVHLVDDCGSSDGRWRHDLGPGCPRIWAVRFGLTAGLRRDRDDLLALARRTASRERCDALDLVLSAIFGSAQTDGPEAFGMPALLASGMLDRDALGYTIFRVAFDRARADFDPATLREDQRTGLAVLMAELARADPREAERHLDSARELAAQVEAPKLRAFALSAIARIGLREGDVAAARAAAESALPTLRRDEDRLLVEPEEAFSLSEYLALVSALADLAVATGSDSDRIRAQAVLDFVFTGPLWDGSVLAHDARRDGERSPRHCSGCNWNALYLVDRLWGDTWRIVPVPPLPDRSEQAEPPRIFEHDLYGLRPDQRGTYGLERFGLTLEYHELPRDAEPPHGALRISLTLREPGLGVSFEGAPVVALSASDEARFEFRGRGGSPQARFTVLLGARRDGLRHLRVVEQRAGVE